MKNSTKRAINIYSKEMCLTAYKEHEAGAGARTIGHEMGVRTSTARCLIKAGRDLTENKGVEEETSNSKILTPHVLAFKVPIPNLLNETFVNAVRPSDLAALRIPLNFMTKYLASVAGRCAELNDPVLNKLMVDMALYEQSDITSTFYSQEMVDQTNKNYHEFMRKQKLS